MMKFLARRLALAALVLLVVASLTFFAMHFRGDPVTEMMLQSGASQADIDRVRTDLGLDRPLILQYLSFLINTLSGDFGSSLFYGQKSTTLILARLPYTALLAVTAMVFTVLAAFPLGIAASIWRGTWVDRLSAAIAALGQSVPSFVIGPLLILLFAVSLRWLPVSGADSPASVVMPAMTLSLYPMSRVSRLLRGCMIAVAESDYVMNARARGLSEISVVARYILRNALIPVMTLLGMQFGALMGGAIVVETMFAWPGLGLLTSEALLNSDFRLAQSAVIFISAVVLSVTLVTDLLYSVADPRIRLD